MRCFAIEREINCVFTGMSTLACAQVLAVRALLARPERQALSARDEVAKAIQYSRDSLRALTRLPRRWPPLDLQPAQRA
jgi:hypothetical protein